jgi:hypothetical protein
MGRKKKYITYEQQKLAKQRDNKLYYERNKKRIKKDRMRRYSEKLEEKLPNVP